MPRKRVQPNIRVALSPSECAEALRVDYNRVIRPEIIAGRLGPVYTRGVARRILVRDLEKWIRDHWLLSGVSHG